MTKIPSCLPAINIPSYLTLVLPRYFLLHILPRGVTMTPRKFVIKHPTFIKLVPWDPGHGIARTLLYPTKPNKVPTLHVCRSCGVISDVM